MDYPQAIDFLSRLVDHEQKPWLARDLTLEPVRGLLTALGNPQDSLCIIHVAGTKGKGSVALMLEVILRQSGYRTGLYTSPDLSGFEERFRINGNPIAPMALAESVGRIRDVFSSAGFSTNQQPSRFDAATALAFLCFESSQVDVAIVEVGMGGRTDSTNVCIPRVSVITSISYDHTRQLGSTLASIATEKAGIIKWGHPTISGVTCDEAQAVVENTCRGQNSVVLRQLGVHFSYHYTPGEIRRSASRQSQIRITTWNRTWPEMSLSLLGEHQAANAAVAVATVETLKELGLQIGDSSVVESLSRVQCPGRIEIMRRQPLVILDCAHNTASAQALLTTLQTSLPEHMGKGDPSGRRLLIFASSRDKDIAGIMAILGPHFDRVFLTQYARSSRCASEDELRAALLAYQADVSTTYVSDARTAWKLAETEARPADLICITGSVFLAGEIRELLSDCQLKV